MFAWLKSTTACITPVSAWLPSATCIKPVSAWLTSVCITPILPDYSLQLLALHQCLPVCSCLYLHTSVCSATFCCCLHHTIVYLTVFLMSEVIWLLFPVSHQCLPWLPSTCITPVSALATFYLYHTSVLPGPLLPVSHQRLPGYLLPVSHQCLPWLPSSCSTPVSAWLPSTCITPVSCLATFLCHTSK